MKPATDTDQTDLVSYTPRIIWRSGGDPLELFGSIEMLGHDMYLILGNAAKHRYTVKAFPLTHRSLCVVFSLRDAQDAVSIHWERRWRKFWAWYVAEEARRR